MCYFLKQADTESSQNALDPGAVPLASVKSPERFVFDDEDVGAPFLGTQMTGTR